jgi:predicted dithiol-disulfide oxidoreductase (DUF899 family)
MRIKTCRSILSSDCRSNSVLDRVLVIASPMTRRRRVHLKHRDVTMIAVSRAPYEKLAAYKKRMGWGFPWVSSSDTEFNFDYHVSFTPEETAKKKAFFNYAMQDPGHSEREGHSVFYKDEGGSVFHSYSCYTRGNEIFSIHYHYLDPTPKGRDEDGRVAVLGATAR